MSSEQVLGVMDKNGSSKNQNKTEVVKTEEKSAGRPEKADEQKSEKTI